MTVKHCFAMAVAMVSMGCSQMSGQAQSELDLTGTSWRATSIDRSPARPGVDSTLSFNEPGKVAGNAGCNQYFGPVEINGTDMKFGLMGMTQMMCPPEQMDQEQAFAKALGRVTRFDVMDGKLLLYADDGGAPIVELEKVQ